MAISAHSTEKSGGGRIDVLTGGFPCQPFSAAGRRRGTQDNRFLWPEMFRVIQEVHPTWIIAENVPGILSINDGLVFEQICTQMESEGYEIQPLIIPACAIGAPHRRDRIWFIAHLKHEFRAGEGIQENAAGQRQPGTHANDALPLRLPAHGLRDRRKGIGKKEILRQQTFSWCKGIRSTQDYFRRSDIPEPLVRRIDDGIRKRLHALGNAIVPQVAFQIFRSIPL